MPLDQRSAPTFSQFPLNQNILTRLEELGYQSPTPIQQESIPHILAGEDMVGQAETGSGKTATFALPILSNIDISNKSTQALILTPTRELAIQVSDAIKEYAKNLSSLRVLPIYGGQSYTTQINFLKKSTPVVVGTPGRIMDLMKKGVLKISDLKTLVLDEADEMLNMGFIDDVEWIIQHTPDTRQTILFSATMPAAIKKISKRHLNNPVSVKIQAKTATASTISQKYCLVKPKFKFLALSRILETSETDGVIIFSRTKAMTMDLTQALNQAGYRAMALNGEMQQKVREKTIAQFKDGHFDIVVATDIAARGIDVERVSHVINYDIPQNAYSYIHRIGRTGRAGRKGEAITLVDYYEKNMLRTIERATKQSMSVIDIPSAEDVRETRVKQFRKKLTDALGDSNQSYYKKIIKDFCDIHHVSELDVAAALACLVQKDKPLTEIAETLFTKTKGESDDFKRNPRSRKKPSKMNGKPSFRERDKDMQRYTINVGKKHGVMPNNIVGAIANELSLSSKKIGQIKINKTNSTVDLPKNLSKQSLELLTKVWIAGQKIKISKASS